MSKKKENKDATAKLKKLQKENKSLKHQISKLKDFAFTDKNLRELKNEYQDCFTECKRILDHLENQV